MVVINGLRKHFKGKGKQKKYSFKKIFSICFCAQQKKRKKVRRPRSGYLTMGDYVPGSEL
jgi:hypothetical protein